MDKGRVAIIVVTYNRINCLKKCVNAIKGQIYTNFDCIIVNNGSTDGTREWLDEQEGLIVVNQDNRGGAGGFYSGMSYMLNHDYEWALLMDDDGLPDRAELFNLLSSYDTIVNITGKDAILNALVVNVDNNAELAFPWKRSSNISIKVDEVRKLKYIDQIQPFNGTLIKRNIIDQIGLIKQEMFIWGDDEEYRSRALHNNIACYTIVDAVHYHPKIKGKIVNIIPFIKRYQIVLKPREMSHYSYRNMGYIYKTYPEKNVDMIKYYLANAVYNILHFDLFELYKFFKYFNRGWRNNFD